MIFNWWQIFLGTLHVLIQFWPLWVILAAVVLVRLAFEVILPDLIDTWRTHRRFAKGEEWRSDRELLQWLRGMTPTDFEKYIADLFSRLGYDAHAVGRSHDGGIDVIAEKDGVKNYIQCKKFITSVVPVGAVRDFYGALADHLANGKGYFITTNKFTLEAEKFAEDKPIELIDGFGLIGYIRMVRKDEVKVEVSNKVCPKCGGALVERKGKFGNFYGCSNYPKCDFTTSA